MLILPDRNLRQKILLPVRSAQWREPSQAQSKDQFGRSNQTRFRIRARLNDGHVVWCGWFDDRDDVDAFLWALVTGSLRYERELWRLPTPWWDVDFTDLSYEFATVTILTSPTGSNQTYTKPADWDDNNNTIECVGGGATGGASSGGSASHQTGGGGGSYASISNFTFPSGSPATYRIAASVAGDNSSTAIVQGGNGNPSWFNNTTDPGAGSDNQKCGAKGGSAGASGTGSRNGGAGGVTATSYGQAKFAGGRGGNLTGASGSGASGGGGAAGPAGIGGNGGDDATTGSGVKTAGGTANNGTDAGGAAGNNDGASGTEWTAAGLGGGGGGNYDSVTTLISSGSGGQYGGGGGGCRDAAGITGHHAGNGAQGIIVITYTPIAASLPGGNQISNPVQPPSRSYSFLSGINLDLIGQDAMAPGRQSTELPKANPPTSWNPASYQQPTNLSLLGPVVFPVGKPLYELPERHRYPPTSYPTAWAWSYNLNLIGQDQLPAGEAIYDTPQTFPAASWIRTWINYEPLTITGTIPIGARAYDTPQRFPATSWPTAWAWSYNLNLVGKDVLPTGRQLTEPMRGYFYPPDLRTTVLNLSLLLQRPPIAQYDWPLPIPPYRMPQSWITPSAPFWLVKPFLQTDWPLPTAPWRSPSLSTWVDPLKLNLIGQDAMAPGQQSTELARGVPLTSWIRTWVWYSLPIAPLNQFPLNQYDWPLPVPQRPGIQLRTWTNSYLLTLIGQDRMAAGAQIYDLARGAPAPVPSWAWSYNLNLIGQDKLPFRQTDWPLPGRQPLFLAAPYLFPIGLAPIPLQPFAQYDWPLPARPPYFNAAPTLVPPSLLILSARPFAQYDWPVPFQASLFRQAPIASSPFFIVKPFAQYDWPLPVVPSAFRPSSAMSAAITFLTVRPFAQSDWPLPQAPQYPASLRTATGDNAVQLQLVTMPQGKASYDLTGRPPHPISLRGYTLSLGPPAFLASAPFRQTDWPLPTQQRPSIQLRTWIDPVKLNLLGKDTRFFVYDRPLPRRQPDPNFSYAYSRFPGLIPTSFAVCAHSEVTAFESTTRVSSATSQTEVVGPLTSNTKFASC